MNELRRNDYINTTAKTTSKLITSATLDKLLANAPSNASTTPVYQVLENAPLPTA
jgi:hypothetical protein